VQPFKWHAQTFFSFLKTLAENREPRNVYENLCAPRSMLPLPNVEGEKAFFVVERSDRSFFFPKFRNWRNINFALALLSAGIENDSEERARGKKEDTRLHEYRANSILIKIYSLKSRHPPRVLFLMYFCVHSGKTKRQRQSFRSLLTQFSKRKLFAFAAKKEFSGEAKR
jgi:hypothetical protein